MNITNMKTSLLYRNIIHTFFVICLGIVLSNSATAQTDAMLTKYMFNSLIFNPAYAGSKDYMSINLIHRTQWLGVKGAPSTQSFSIHTPMKGFNRIGFGGTIINQTIGTNKSLTANLSYAYRIKLGGSPYAGTLSIGMQGGVTNWRANFSNLDVYNDADESFGDAFPSYNESLDSF